MSPIRAALAVLCAAAALAGAPSRPAAQSQVAQPQPDAAPRIRFRDRTLPNGLRVLSVQDRTTPSVALQLWYGLGSRDDPPGRVGMAHLVEHLMFQGSRNVKPSQMVQMAEDMGWPSEPGSQSLNGVDAIRVFQEVPSEYLETFLWAEADRLAGLVVTDSLLEFEREAVLEELRGGFLASPPGRFTALMLQETFVNRPYHNLEFGDADQVGKVTLEEVRAHGARFFRPDNVVMVVVGDFEPARLDALVDRYFGVLPRPSAPLARAPAEEPARTAERRTTAYGPTREAMVGISFPTPPGDSDDLAALQVAREILGGSPSARLWRSLVQEQRLAVRSTANLLPRQAQGAFLATAIGGPQATAEKLEEALRAEIARMRDEPVSEEELERARNRLATDALRRMETHMGKADVLGEAAVLGGGPERAATLPARIRAVTAEDVRGAMRKYAAESRFFVLHFLPEAARPAGGEQERGGR